MMLELKNIYKTYMQGKLEVPVLKNISLAVENGEYVAIMGPSGSGKTTLMNIIGCLDNASSGEYLLEGRDIAQNNDTKMSEVRLHSIGFVFQSFYLLSRQSAIENVALPLLYAGVKRRERLEIAQKALERVGLGDRTNFKPTQLSGGQCQRVAIARAIVNNPKILLADEPTGALDTKSGEQIMEIFKSLNEEGVTIVMITHEPEIAAHAQRTLHIRDGRLMDAEGRFLNPESPEASSLLEEAASPLSPVQANDAGAPAAAPEVPVQQPSAVKTEAPVAHDPHSGAEDPAKSGTAQKQEKEPAKHTRKKAKKQNGPSSEKAAAPQELPQGAAGKFGMPISLDLSSAFPKPPSELKEEKTPIPTEGKFDAPIPTDLSGLDFRKNNTALSRSLGKETAYEI